MTVRTVGVEEELMLFSADGLRPAPVGELLADDPSTSVEHEFKLEQAEIASEPTEDLGALEADLRARRDEIIGSAAQRGALVAAIGTSPLATAPTGTPDERYEHMQRRYGLIARDQLTCGAHVHVSIRSRDEGVRAINGVRRWTALLLALTANSPYWSGVDSGYASYRSISWGRWPTAGPTEAFVDPDDYDRRVAALVESGASLDPAMIYFDVRLSAKYPTVEFRVADVGQDVADPVLLAALCRAAVDTAAATAAEPFDAPLWRLQAAAWRAARYGLSGKLVDVTNGRTLPAANLIDRTVEQLAPALNASGDAELVRTSLDRLLARGTGADLQRAEHARRGRAADVIRAAARRTAGTVADK